MRALRHIRAVARKELHVLIRDRFYIIMAIVVPVATLIILGYGMNYDVNHLPLGIADFDRTMVSRELADAFTASGYFRVALVTPEPRALDRALDAGRIRVTLEIPSGFARALDRGELAEVQILVDGSFPTRAEIARGYVAAIVARFNQDRLEALAQRTPGIAVAMEAGPAIESRIWFNPTLESNKFIVPGALALSLVFWPPMLTSLAVAREKEMGAILNIQTAPVLGWEYVVGKLVPYAGMSFVSYWLLLLASQVPFHVPVTGSVLLLSAGALFFVIAMSALGLLVSILVRTQVAALIVTAIIVVIPGYQYSGFSEPLGTLDAAGQAISRLLPVADFMHLTRGVYLKGFAFSDGAGSLARLILYAGALGLAAVMAFRKRRR